MCDSRRKADQIRRLAFRLMADVGGGHYGGNLSEIEILTVLYDGVINVRPKQPSWEQRDRFIMSKGHGGFGLYTVLSYFGFVDYEYLAKRDKDGVMIPKHASTYVPGVEVSTGSLGQGLSIATGMALSIKADSLPMRVYTMLGDGECNEGQVWEAAMAAGKYKLDNLVAIIDNNHLGFDGYSKDVMSLDPFAAKWEAFGWYVIEADGHNTVDLKNKLQLAKTLKNRPTVVIADTIKGKGISYMENMVGWHAGTVSEQQYKQGMRELEAE